ncbi:5-oxoprolinase subunit B family protein [Cohaesibacter haloalkalitolerans]|uniref:5-oxoprolinase subunit B family protein n=1 Tax=Cohaesibacter haloalkalitolerans TaxID=1162980 RepID=UPI000E653B76|nr:allophanate hydrolase subunit 1 [Cohaesibacter haloalkalitolerans]
MAVSFLPSGDRGLTVQFGFDIDRGLSRQIMALRAAVDDAAIAGVIETVPTYRSLLVHYDPVEIRQAALIERLKPLLANLDGDDKGHATRWHLPICFEGDCSPDLDFVADFASLSRDEVKTVMTGTEHFVYMLGFAPGMPYMGDLPAALNIPRRSSPVQGIPKGSVLVATGLTVIYPAVNPSGWHVVGRCPVPLFDLGKADPVLLSPGDRVCFREVSLADYEAIAERVEQGDPVVEGEPI